MLATLVVWSVVVLALVLALVLLLVRARLGRRKRIAAGSLVRALTIWVLSVMLLLSLWLLLRVRVAVLD